MDKVPRHMRQRAAAELRRYAYPVAVATLGLVLSASCGVCTAQDLRLIDACPDSLVPVQRVFAKLPERHVGLAWTYDVTASFVVDVDGSVVAPKISQSRFSVVSNGAAPTPVGFDAAVIAAISQWKYPRRASPCSASAQQSMSFIADTL